MFGIIRPCRNRLGADLSRAWLAHLCGLCLTLRDDHGHLARLVTNYDGLVVSALVEAQAEQGPGRRSAGACLLRGMRGADVAIGSSVRLAASVSLVLAAAKVRDHVEDGDGLVGRAGARSAARRVATRWARQGASEGVVVGFDTAVLLDAVARQGELEATTRLGDALLAVTEPTETATAAAFAHTALLAGRPANQEPLAEAGRLFGRVAHLLDAVEDLAEDAATGAWNPLAATGTDLAIARRLCDDAVLGVHLALREARFADPRLVDGLLGRELRHAVNRTFGANYPGPPPGGYPPQPGGYPQQPPGWYPQQPPGGYPQQPPQPGYGQFPGQPGYGQFPGQQQPDQFGPMQGSQQFYGPEPGGPPGPPARSGCWGSCCDGCGDNCCCEACECCECLECCDCCNC
ncbi:MAG TPA: DUF5685 family protein [Pseudonocardiaceae bacterium]|nr:DUF5685 family protein [Pseudonocardiaceae bacterium]